MQGPIVSSQSVAHQVVRPVSVPVAGRAASESALISRPQAPIVGPGDALNPSFTPPRELDLEQHPITLEGLQRAWGTSAPQYDLNADGTVNMSDLLLFLASQPKPETPDAGPDLKDPGPPPVNPGDVAPTDEDGAGPILTEEGFQEAWGTDNADYDLNGDGTVNISDLLQFLAEHAPAAAPADDADVLTDTPGELTEEGFSQAWGTADATYDLNGDGTVNMVDLLAFLDQQNQPTADVDNGVPGGDAASLMEQFQAAWGTDDPQFDLNGDGTVNMSDLLAYLAQLGGNGNGTSEASAGPPASPNIANGLDPARLGRSLVARFENAGFIHEPPANTRQIVDGLGLDELAHRLIIDHLASRYPHGLGVDVAG